MAGDKLSRSERRRLAQRAAPELIATQRSISYERSGPLPDPSELAGFKQVSPDLPDRIVTMAEEEAAHRRRREIDMLSAQR